MHNWSARAVFSDADTQALRSISLYCRDCDIAELRKLREYCSSGYAMEVADTIVKISRKRSLSGVPPDVRRWAVKFMNEAGTYNGGR